MKTIVIYCHPNDVNLENKLLNTVLDELKAASHKATVYNIIEDFFSQKGEDYIENFTIDDTLDNAIRNIQNEIIDCKHLVFVFPVYWDKLTHYIRRFIDYVFLGDWDTKTEFISGRKLKNKKATIITSMRIPQIVFSGRSVRGHSNPFTFSILKLCGIQNIKWFNISNWVDSNPKLKNKKIDKMRAHFIQLQE